MSFASCQSQDSNRHSGRFCFLQQSGPRPALACPLSWRMVMARPSCLDVVSPFLALSISERASLARGPVRLRKDNIWSQSQSITILWTIPCQSHCRMMQLKSSILVTFHMCSTHVHPANPMTKICYDIDWGRPISGCADFSSAEIIKIAMRSRQSYVKIFELLYLPICSSLFVLHSCGLYTKSHMCAMHSSTFLVVLHMLSPADLHQAATV